MRTLQPRSVRNSNPGNLDIGEKWQGLMPRSQMNEAQLAETRFCVFLNPKWGFRALAILLRNYERMYRCYTVQSIISRFAPASENDTNAYIKAVCDGMGVDAKEVLNLTDPSLLQSLCKAIAFHEAGGWFFTNENLIIGVSWAIGSTGERPEIHEHSHVGKRHLMRAA